MKILIAPDKFKHALDAAEVAEALAVGVHAARPDAEIAFCPLADGGEGTGRLLARITEAEEHSAPVLDPLGREREARWWWDALNATAIVEMAEASGLALLTAAEREPMRTTTFGTGQLIRAALDAGARNILVCVGGSATVDGGAGCLQALGWQLLDATGQPVASPAAGGTTRNIAEVHPPSPVPAVRIDVLCDVNNPLCGPRGAAAVFAPQKGASPEQVALLDAALENWGDVLSACTGRGVSALPGAGAAGGLPAGLAAALGARLVSGFDAVAQRLDLHAKLADCDLCLSGEGCIDEQTTGGKVVAGVAALARQVGVPTVAFAGAARPDPAESVAQLAERVGLREIIVITPPGVSGEAALAATAQNLRAAAQQYVEGWA